MTMTKALVGLRDVPGVQGSFLLDPNGSVLANDLNVFFRPEAVALAGQKLANLFAMIDANDEPVEEVVAAFNAYTLVARRQPHATLVLLVQGAPKFEPIRMATNMVLRGLVRDVGQPASPARPEREEPGSTRISSPPVVARARAPQARKSKTTAPKKGSIWG